MGEASGDEARPAPQRRRGVAAELDSLAQVLGLIRSETAGTRQEIERVSGLSRAVVADRIGTLIARGLVLDGELAASTGGRAPRQVALNAMAGHVLVASLGTTTLGVGLADLSGRLLVEHHEPADISHGAQQTLPRLDELFAWMLDEHATGRETWAIALAVPGLVGPTGGTLGTRPTLHMMPGWNEYPVFDHLSERFGAEVLVDSEVHLMALGEVRVGQGPSAGDLIFFVKIGTGISAALCASGRIYRGAHGYAGDIGHVKIAEDGGLICRCGNTGCLETLAGGLAIAREGLAAAQDGRSPVLAERLAAGSSITAAQVGAAAGLGDPFSVELLSRCGRLIGETVATLVAGCRSVPRRHRRGRCAGRTDPGGCHPRRHLSSEPITGDRRPPTRAFGARQDRRIDRWRLRRALDGLFAPDRLRAWIDHGSPRVLQSVAHGSTRQGRRLDGVDSPRGRTASAVTL